MPYSLRRISDGAGDTGSCSQALKVNDSKDGVIIVSDRPTIGCAMLVGSGTARTYSYQDYWLTTSVEEILEETETYVKFRTRNSIYE